MIPNYGGYYGGGLTNLIKYFMIINSYKYINLMNNYKNLIIENGTRIHFIGIGGKGLNGIAKICLEKGCKVTGSDINDNEETRAIAKSGASVFKGHSEIHINKDIDIVVRSSVISDKCPEFCKSNELGIPILKRSEFLRLLMKPYKKISIAGSHGKSTTTSLFGLALLYVKQDPTIISGAYIKELRDYCRLGNGEYIIVEACEYDRSFHDLISDVGVITNIEKSHMEYYKTESIMVSAFKEFVEKFSKDSVLIVNGDNRIIKTIVHSAKSKVISFGQEEHNDYIIKNIVFNAGFSNFEVYKNNNGKKISDFCIKIPGLYNIYNYTSVVSFFDHFNIPIKGIKQLGGTFTGIKRRFDIKGGFGDLVIIDDFAHHPTQVKNLLSSIKQFFPQHDICAVFQPRQYHLIKTFLSEYGNSFKVANQIILTDLVPALGDTNNDKKSLTIGDVINSIKINSKNNNIKYLNNFSEIIKYLNKYKNTKTVIVTIGAGDVYKIGDSFLNNLNKNEF